MAHEQAISSGKHFHPTQSSSAWASDQIESHAGSLHMARHATDILTGALGFLLGTRLVLLLFGLQSASGFARAISAITQPFTTPFAGILPDSIYGAMNGGKLDTATILAMIAIAFLGYALRQLLEALEPRPLILDDPQI